MNSSRAMDIENSRQEDEFVPRNINLIINLQERLNRAALYAKMSLESSPDINPAVVISDESRCSIVINEVEDERTGEEYFVIHRGNNGSSRLSSSLVRIPKERYKYVYLSGLRECRVFVKCKLLRIMFDNCESCQISLRSPIIGPAEFFRCKTINLSIRMQPEDIPPIPVTTIENCEQFHIFQSVDTLVYLVKMCIDISGTIVDLHTGERLNKYNLGGKLFWGEQERTCISLSQDEGFAAVQERYILNDMEQHIIIRPPDEDLISSNVTDIFGVTPPVGDGWKNYLASRK